METSGGALETFRRYTRAFESLEPRSMVPFLHQPALFISPQGVVVLSTPEEVERFFIPVMADLRGRGYRSSEFSGLTERALSADLTIVGGTAVWRTASGEVLRRFGLTYTLRRAAEGWKLVVATIHEPDAPGSPA